MFPDTHGSFHGPPSLLLMDMVCVSSFEEGSRCTCSQAKRRWQLPAAHTVLSIARTKDWISHKSVSRLQRAWRCEGRWAFLTVAGAQGPQRGRAHSAASTCREASGFPTERHRWDGAERTTCVGLCSDRGLTCPAVPLLVWVRAAIPEKMWLAPGCGHPCGHP